MKPKYVGIQTQQAMNNFPMSTHIVHLELVMGIVLVKKACASANYEAKNISEEIFKALDWACDEILSRKYDDQFVTAAIQGGAGTSINMNINEVIAQIASERANMEIHPNDDVNHSQSTNDVNPTGLKVALISLLRSFIVEVENLANAFESKSKQFGNTPRLGRTHIQDAVPITFGSQFASYTASIRRGISKLKEYEKYLFEVNLGGTAVGNRINASEEYIEKVYEYLQEFSGFDMKPATNMMSQTSSQTDLVHLNMLITLLFVDLSKIATDLRLLSSGPRGGIGEIRLEPKQAGSSIMPGKVNPVIAEYINQVYYYISGKNLTVQHAAEGANLELGIMFPVLADSVISSIKVATDAVKNFRLNCIETLEIDEQNALLNLEVSTAYATLLTPKLGYDKVSEFVKKAIKEGKTVREVIIADGVITAEEFDQIIKV